MHTEVRTEDISCALQRIGIVPGDTVLVHSSMKSMGHVIGGAEAVIAGFENVLGKEGTLVMPTLCQVDFANSYKTWYMDKPSDVGYLTEFFRKQLYVYRSNQATHSVAARGKNAYMLTCEHTAYGPHLCPFGEYAFADSSPWAKLYDMDAKIVFLGVPMLYNTMKHLIEARYVEGLLADIKDEKKRAGLQARLRRFDSAGQGLWPFYHGTRMQVLLEEQNLVQKTTCGDATILCVSAKQSSDAALKLLRSRPEYWYKEEMLHWIRECEET